MNLIQIQLDSIRRALSFIDYSKPKRINYSKPKRIDSDYESNIDMNDDDMSRLQDIAPDNYMDHRRYLPQQERDTFQFPIQRDPTDWLNPYAQGDRDSYEDIQRERLEEFLQYASTNDAYW